MATISWIIGKVATYFDGSAWQGGVAPGTLDTGVISSAGAPAPTTSGHILVPATGSSVAVLAASTTLATLVEGSSVKSGVTTDFFTTSAPSAVPTGETLAGGTLDLIAGGAESALLLQNSTVAAAATMNVNGDAYLSAGYTNTLAGAINIGLPFSVNGVAQAQPKADADGFTSALFVDVQPWGSWTGVDVPASYTPTITNSGAITIGGGSALVIQLEAEAADLLKKSSTLFVSLPPEDSQFDNSGLIVVQPGGTLAVAINPGGVFPDFVNTGSVVVQGALGKTSEALFVANLTGTGKVKVKGGTQTNFADTVLQLDGQGSIQKVKIDGGSLVLAPNTFDVNSSGATYGGGTIGFGTAHGVLQINAPVEHTVAQLFADPINGFVAGDQIKLSYFLISSESWAPSLTWNQATDTLQLFDVFTNGGTQTKSLQASFVINGTYSAASFHVTGSWNGLLSSPASVVITDTQTTTASASAPSAAPAASAASATDAPPPIVVLPFIAAAASLGAPTSGSSATGPAWRENSPMLLAATVHFA